MMITEPFQVLASAFAAKLGIPGYHNVVMPHPIASKDDEALRKYAIAAADTFARQLATG